MVHFNELREGMSLGGLYTLEEHIGDDATGAFFGARDGDGERVWIKLVPDDGTNAGQLAVWQRSRHLRHDHLLQLRDVGEGELGGGNYVYAVFEAPDDVLASALEQGPLSEAETRGVLEAALGALRYLHSQGMVHGSLSADHVVAVGETVKLTTDSLRESDDLGSYAEDVRQLGELVRSLRAPEPLAGPLQTIVRHATASDPAQRWTLAEIATALEPPPPPPAPPAAPVVIPEAAPPVEPAAPGPAKPRPWDGIPKWIFVGVALLLLSILYFNLRRKPEPVVPTPVSVAPQPQRAAPAAPVPVPAHPRVSGSAAPTATGEWRVIAFTYRSRAAAEKKAESINHRWPNLRAAVFTPRRRAGYYLVALGGRMSREEAIRLQRKARSLGMPRDVFVQNYSE